MGRFLTWVALSIPRGRRGFRGSAVGRWESTDAGGIQRFPTGTRRAAGLAWVALLAGHAASYAEIVVPLVIAGVGISMAIPTMPLAVMGAVVPQDMGIASGVLNMLQRFGGVVAVAVASAVFVSNGHLGTAVSFDNGFRPALLVPAGMSVLGSVFAILARRPRAKAVDLTGAGAHEEKTTAGAAAA